MKKRLLAILLLSLLFASSACSKSSSGGSTSKNNDETVAFATKMDLFNELENIIKKIPQKKYSDAYDALSNVFKLSNKSGFVADPKDEDSKKYITDLNQFATDVYHASKTEKENKVAYDYQKSQLNILSNVLSNGEKSSQGASESSGSSASASSSGSSSDSGAGSEAKDSGDSSGSSTSGQEASQGSEIVIPEQEMREKYPELTLTQSDFNIYDMASDMLGYVSKVTLESKPENETALVNRQKYLLYKIQALSKLSAFGGAKEFIVEAQSNWGKLYIKIPDENQHDVVTFNALLKNIETSLSKKNDTSVELQTQLAIELLDTIASKMKSA